MLDGSINHFLDELQSNAPVPGGGSTSALAGALGAALGHMAGALTVGKPKYADVDGELREMMTRMEDLRSRLGECVNKDVQAFEPLSRAYKIPKDDPDRERVLEECLRNAAAAPMEIMELCCEAMEVNKVFTEKASWLVISDAATGSQLCRAALFGGALNVKVNTKLMKDREYAESMNKRVDELLERYGAAADEIYRAVFERFS